MRCLILHRPNGELETDPFTRQPPIDLSVSIEPEIHTAPLLFIQHDLQHFTPILARARALPHNLNGIHHVPQDRIVHGGQGAGVRPFLGLRGPRPIRAFGPGEDAP